MSKQALRRAAQRAAHKAKRQDQITILTAAATAAPPKTLTATASSEIKNHPSYNPNYIFKDDPDPSDVPTPPSEARIAANRSNAQKSSGPVTPEGKATSALNALKHGLTGNTLLVDSADAEAYQHRLEAHVEQFKPVTFEERRLVQSIHDSAWRLDSILNLESTIYAKGRIELDGCFGDLPEDQRKSFTQLEIYERNGKKLRNLHLLEGRLQRQRAKDIAALKLLMKERKEEEKAAAEAAKTPATVSLKPVGFVFSTCQTASREPVIQAPDPMDLAA